ncbi:MAG TPA: hypothetical protein VHP32_00705 [Ignavibacteria bacterium]|nr:hypothetical protein [Ignavibacteria bacterium]
MYKCVWSIKIIFGKQKEALDVIKAWGAEKFRSSHFKVSKNSLFAGYVGETPSCIVDEYLFESLADFEKALDDMKQPQFKKFSEQLAPFVVPASQEWVIYRMIE